MANKFYNTQIRNIDQPSSGQGVKPLSPGKPDLSMPMRTARWPGLPGEAGPDRSAGAPEEKVYAFAQGLRGGSDEDKGESKDS